MRFAKPIVLVVVSVLCGCQDFLNDRGIVSLAPPTSSQRIDIAEPESLAYLTVASLKLERESVEPGHPFTAILVISNDGESESKPFEVEVQANLITSDSERAYPIGGKVVLRLNPHQVIQIMVTRKEGLIIPGTYKIMVSLHSVNLEVPGAVDRFNPNMPEKQLIVKQRPY
ncbi:MAG: hypothetical protein ACXV7J_09690 [Methylomonas sp.]